MLQSDSVIHPDLRRTARFLPRAAIGARSLQLVRVATLATTLLPNRGVTVEQISPGVSVRVHEPPRRFRSGGALLWIHGGGYVIGNAQQDDAVCRRFAERLGILVVAVDYRLAPEYPFPAPLDDCRTALAWLAAHPDVDPARIAIGGASAGGGLAAALALDARLREEHEPCFQLLVYPMLDDRTASTDNIDRAGFRLWNSRSNRFGWRAYTGLAPGDPAMSPLAAPARQPDLSGLAPAWIGVGTLDLFHDEDVAYADRLRNAGVSCEVSVVDGAFHGFDLIVPKATVSRAFTDAQLEALGKALDGIGPT